MFHNLAHPERPVCRAVGDAHGDLLAPCCIVPCEMMADKRKPNNIDRLDYPSSSALTPLLGAQSNETTPRRHGSSASICSGHFFQRVAQGIQAKEREAVQREARRYVSFIWAIVCWSVASTCLLHPCITTDLVQTASVVVLLRPSPYMRLFFRQTWATRRQ